MRMGYEMNIFDYVEDGAVQGQEARWSARSPFRPAQFDLMLVPRTPDWREDASSRAALERIEAEPWVEAVAADDREVLLRLTDDWIEETGRRLENGENAADADLAEGQRYAVYFWGANM